MGVVGILEILSAIVSAIAMMTNLETPKSLKRKNDFFL